MKKDNIEKQKVLYEILERFGVSPDFELYEGYLPDGVTEIAEYIYKLEEAMIDFIKKEAMCYCPPDINILKKALNKEWDIK